MLPAQAQITLKSGFPKRGEPKCQDGEWSSICSAASGVMLAHTLARQKMRPERAYFGLWFSITSGGITQMSSGASYQYSACIAKRDLANRFAPQVQPISERMVSWLLTRINASGARPAWWRAHIRCVFRILKTAMWQRNLIKNDNALSQGSQVSSRNVTSVKIE